MKLSKRQQNLKNTKVKQVPYPIALVELTKKQKEEIKNYLNDKN